MSSVRSAYVHVPFCRHRCGYCNFTLVAGRSDLIPDYLKALEQELQTNLAKPQAVETLYFGGGTPSHFAIPQLEQLLELTTSWLVPTGTAEVTCEVNPQDVSLDKLHVLKQFGVNRLSLGGQSFSDRKLQLLERDHCGAELVDSVHSCAENFPNLSLDLIFAVPGESFAEWQGDVDQALALPVTHLSTYGLTIEKGSAFYGREQRQQLQALDDDSHLQYYSHVMDRTLASGWEHYEVSSFARQRQWRSRHNETYWLGQPWWAFGPGAASFLPAEIEGEFVRKTNHRSTFTYLKKIAEGASAVAESESISREAYVRERLVFGLRRLEGVNLQELSELWGESVMPLFEPYLERFIEQGWLEYREPDHLALTRSGLVVSDALWPDLISGS